MLSLTHGTATLISGLHTLQLDEEEEVRDDHSIASLLVYLHKRFLYFIASSR